MSKDNSKLRIQKSKFFIVFWVMSLFLLAFSQTIIRSTRTNRPIINFAADIQFTYDDNIFLYSENDLKDFQRSIRPYRFPFETSDDFITILTGSIKLRQRLFNQKPSIFSLLYRQHVYSVNRVKSYQFFSLKINQYVTKPLTIEIGYLFLPKYLIRYYKDPTGQTSPPDYIGCEFAEHLFSLELIYKFIKKVTFTPFYKFEIDNYISKFNYYDTKAHRLGLNGNFRLQPIISLRGKFEYKIAQAEGPVPDISYDQLAWSIGLQFGKKLKVIANYGQERRDFVTDNLPDIDPFHFGRVDKTRNLKFSLEIPLTRAIWVDANYEFEKRDVTSPYKETIDEVKDYQKNRFGLGINFRRF